jgi:signal transduction histidine kinase
LLFGLAVVLILSAALGVVWFRMSVLVAESQEQACREIAQLWLRDIIHLGEAMLSPERLGMQHDMQLGITLTLIDREEFAFTARADPFVTDALDYLRSHDDAADYFDEGRDGSGKRIYRYAQPIRRADLAWIRGGAATGYRPTVDVLSIANPLEMLLVVERQSPLAQQQSLLNPVYIVAAGLLAGLLAIGTFWYITMRLILSPVRVLRDTAEQVAQGDLNIRADINTGDEFEQLSDVFNNMLANLKSNQDQLRSINKSLDLKLGELAEHNVALFEANRIKGEFLANVSHELRTPLNSIVGFAELLQDTLVDRTEPIDDKRKRYAGNIIHSSRQLLDLINDLLDLAKIEAGRIDLNVAPMSVADMVEALVNLIRPQADKKRIAMDVKIPARLPMVHTDASKCQQIVFNFLANAVKFTPDEGRVTIEAKMVGPDDDGGKKQRLIISVSDTGPGIDPSMRDRIFEKFTQLDSTVTREHAGTGLGLTIAKELTAFLRGRIEVESQLGQGATFSLNIPLVLEERSVPLMPDIMDVPTAPMGR